MRKLALLLPLAFTGCLEAPLASSGGYRMQTGMIVSSSLEVMWRDEMKASDFQFEGLWFAPLAIDVLPNGRYAGTSRNDFQAMADAYSAVMEGELATRFTLVDGPGRHILTVRATVADVIRSESLQTAGAGSFRTGSAGETGEAVLIFEFRVGDHVLAEFVSRMSGARLNRGLYGRLGSEDLLRAFEPFALRMHTSMIQTSG